jgi:hypothetical protein
VKKTLLSVKFRRKSTNILILSELIKLRKSNEIEELKVKVPLFGR